MPNFGYHFARLKGNALRQCYRTLLPSIVRRRINPPREVDIDVFAYSNEEMLPEQIASIRSFLRYVGRPKSFTVVSDGSHSERSIRLLKDVDLSVNLRRPTELPNASPEKLRDYLTSHSTGKQLALIMSLPVGDSALYIDSDVRFFPAAHDLVERAATRDAPAYYLSDCQFSGDDRLLRDPSETRAPVNTGVLLLFDKLDWSFAIDRFLEMEGEPNFFTNQTMAHITMHKNGARPFDPARYVLQLDDQFILQDRHASAALALRHYVNPVRHKFWTSLRY